MRRHSCVSRHMLRGQRATYGAFDAHLACVPMVSLREDQPEPGSVSERTRSLLGGGRSAHHPPPSVPVRDPGDIPCDLPEACGVHLRERARRPGVADGGPSELEAARGPVARVSRDVRLDGGSHRRQRARGRGLGQRWREQLAAEAIEKAAVGAEAGPGHAGVGGDDRDVAPLASERRRNSREKASFMSLVCG